MVFHVFAQLNCQKKFDHYEENCMRYCPIKIDLQTESKETESEAQQENTEGAEEQQQGEEEPNLREFTLIISR